MIAFSVRLATTVRDQLSLSQMDFVKLATIAPKEVHLLNKIRLTLDTILLRALQFKSNANLELTLTRQCQLDVISARMEDTAMCLECL